MGGTQGSGEARRPARPWLGPRFEGISTDAAPPRERFDFWESLFSGTEMAPMAAGVPFRAGAFGGAGDDGVVFTDMACDPIAAHFPGDTSDQMLLSVLLRGSIQVTHGDDRRVLAQPGAGVHLYDCSRGSHADSPGGYRSFYLTLPRAFVIDAMGAAPVAGGEALRVLPETPLSLVIKSHLRVLSCYAGEMAPEESAAAMEALSGMTAAYLRGFGRPALAGDGADDALFLAARCYIDAWKEDPGLTAAVIAGALGCSRSTLYRAFDRRGLSIGDEIRRMRLDHSRTLLRDPTLDIGDVSLRCGYADLSAFGKAFRRQFGMSPRAWRSMIA